MKKPVVIIVTVVAAPDSKEIDPAITHINEILAKIMETLSVALAKGMEYDDK